MPENIIDESIEESVDTILEETTDDFNESHDEESNEPHGEEFNEELNAASVEDFKEDSGEKSVENFNEVSNEDSIENSNSEFDEKSCAEPDEAADEVGNEVTEHALAAGDTETIVEEIKEYGVGEQACEPIQEVVEKNTVVPSNTIVLKKSYLAIGAAVIVFLLTGAVLLGMWINRGNGMKIDPNAVPYTGNLFSGAPVAEQITLPGYSDIVFPAGQRNVQIVLPNPEGNTCYFVFSLVLNETGEELYRSGLIPSGMAVNEILLSRPLEAGVYDLRICIEPLSLEEKKPLNGGVYETVLTVINN